MSKVEEIALIIIALLGYAVSKALSDIFYCTYVLLSTFANVCYMIRTQFVRISDACDEQLHD